MSTRRMFGAVLGVLALAGITLVAPAEAVPGGGPGAPEVITSGLVGAQGSAVGPGGDLFVAEGAAGRITRIDPDTGNASTFAEGLPAAVLPVGGVVDVAFIGSTAYALVTLVDLGQPSAAANGIYRIDGPTSATLLADIGAWSRANPPATDFDLDAGVQYAIEVFHGRLLVSDGHHNRVLEVSTSGEITEMIAFGNNVPTGLETQGNTVYLSVAGPVPHPPADGQVLAFGPDGSNLTEVAAGAPLNVDVERGRGQTMFALGQGFHAGGPAGSPAEPNTGELLMINADGTMSSVVDGLNLPTSLEIIGNTAYVVTLTGDVVRIANIAGPPYR